MKKSMKTAEQTELRKSLGKRLRRFRMSKHVSQQELADMLGVSKDSYSNWEIGRSGLTVEAIIALAKFYHISTDNLLGLEREIVSSDLTDRILALTPMQQDALEKLLFAMSFSPQE